MRAEYVHRSSTKARLMQALHLSPGDQAHESLYLAIKRDCNQGYDAICEDRRNLKPEFEHVPGRFTFNQMKPEAIDRAIGLIYQNASTNVRGWYDHWQVDGSPNNFIIAWFLYHSFRNHDARNDRKARSMEFHADDDDKDDGPQAGPSSGSSAAGKGTSTGTSAFYDPARNGYRGS